MRCKPQNEQMVSGFVELPKDDRKLLYQTCSSLFGDDLKKKVSEMVQWSTSKRSTCKFGEVAEYLDEEEVREKFKNKPEQAKILCSKICARLSPIQV